MKTQFRQKKMWLAPINRAVKFDKVPGSYYDYAASIYAGSEEKEAEIRHSLESRGWEEVPNNNSILLLFYHERHVIRIWQIYK